MSATFPVDLGAGATLALRDLATVPEMHRLMLKNLDRLRAWEGWAHGEQSEGALAYFTQAQLDECTRGICLPGMLLHAGAVVGTTSARISNATRTADVGYWIDADHEGRGLVTRAVAALIDVLIEQRGVQRVEIRASTDNVRSRAVAERLGFTHEGTLREAIAVGGARQDAAVYGLLAREWRSADPAG